MDLQMCAARCGTLIDHSSAAVHPRGVDQGALLVLILRVANAAAEVGGTCAYFCTGMSILPHQRAACSTFCRRKI